MNYRHAGTAVIITIGLVLAGTINLDSTPPLWWDEGWLLTVARNWVEQGYYGRFLSGKANFESSTNGFPVVAPIALSFRLFGIGIWQARVIGVVFLIGAVWLIYYLALRCYNQSVAKGTLVVLLFMVPGRIIHPVIMARQAVGEMPAMFYLLAGYACFSRAFNAPIRYLPLTAFFWGTALITKLQVLPFWAVSLAIPLFIAVSTRNWRVARLMACGLLGSLIVAWILRLQIQMLVSSETLPLSSIGQLYDISVWVPVASIRRMVLVNTLMYWFPTICGFCYATWSLAGDAHDLFLCDHKKILRLAVLVLAGSWFGWYLFFSIGWQRYLFPPVFIGSIFVAAILYELTNRFQFSSTLAQGFSVLKTLRFNWKGWGAVLAIVLITYSCIATAMRLYQSFIIEPDNSVLEVATFLNTQTAPDALIETYESELFFLLNRPYHYPPDQLHVDLNRRTFLQRDVPISYDPLAFDPDYLVLGPMSWMWQLYDPIINTKQFELLRSFRRYDVYKRVR
jgi:hypothetical protein